MNRRSTGHWSARFAPAAARLTTGLSGAPFRLAGSGPSRSGSFGRWRSGPVRPARVRTMEAGRAVWGVLLIVAPGAVLRAAGSADRRVARNTMRVLGARHVAQAALSGLRPRRTTVAVGALVDALHAASDVAIAAVDPRYRRIATIDAVVTAAWSGLGGREATRRP
ncbi:hypothetical protein [Micromonospora zhanjiangensis]|uniref:DUF4129 domain-containing protein n=1 Tax=Micromonospora zhanjiangensis TaxID=1522057 RepID=A0ABV8KRB7_9ACTN